MYFMEMRGFVKIKKNLEGLGGGALPYSLCGFMRIAGLLHMW